MGVYKLITVFAICVLATTTRALTSVDISIQEELPINYPVTYIGTLAKLDVNRTVEDFNALKYTYLSQSEQATTYFDLDINTGELKVIKRIDRDAICPGDQCFLTFDVGVTSSRTQSFFVITVNIKVIDVNDNSPHFPASSWLLEIPENSAPNSVYELPSATDNDTSSLFSVQKFDYSPKSELFNLTYSRKLDGGFVVQLQVKESLDRETRSMFQITIIATDGGPNPNSGQMLVNISVIDMNDNPPVFGQSSYNQTVRENSTTDTPIMSVSATDRDSGENKRVTYTIVYTSVADQFRIDANNGDIYIVKQLKYTGHNYSMIIEASDHGDGPKVAQAKVFISVEDSINNAPVVQINILSGPGDMVYMLESANIGAFVAHVKVEDSDVGENKRVACSSSNPYFKVEPIPNGFKVTIKQRLDRESIPMHHINVTCHDFGEPNLSGWANFTVNVTDANDNRPTFTKDVYLASMSEHDIDIGTRIGIKVEAIDHDHGLNAEVSYYLDSTAGSNFAINSQTGVITARHGNFDRETTPEFTFKVLAVDHGDPARTGEAGVILTILDYNDNVPFFNKTMFSFYVLENQSNNAFVGKVTAHDNDMGENSRLTFSLEEQDRDAVPFIVLPDGTIQTTQTLDREAKAQYNFKVMVKDNGDFSLNSSAHVTIYVDDANDNDPSIDFPNKMNHTVWTTSGTTLPITTIHAFDKDIGDNRKLTYYIHSGNENDMFLLHPESGELFLNENYRFTRDISVDLVICVKDSGNPVRSKCAQLITFVNISNSTTAALTDTSSNSYIIISIVVVIVTVFVSVAIIVTIIFLKRMDNQRSKQKHGPLGVPVPSNYSPATSQHDVNISLDYTEKQSDVSLNKTQGHYSQSTTKPSLYDPVNESTTTGYSSSSMQLSAQHLQQFLLTSKPQAVSTSPRHPDNDSDMSAETIASDSGKGGSEEDMPSHAADESRSMDGHHGYRNSLRKDSSQTDFTKRNKNRLLSPDHSVSNRPASLMVTKSRPLYNTPEQSGVATDYLLTNENRGNLTLPSLYTPRQCTSHTNLSESYIDNKVKSFNVSTWDYLRPNNSSSYKSIDKNRDYFSLRPDSMSTLRSRDDEDDGNTTTSGSYTLDPDELDHDFYHQHDLVV